MPREFLELAASIPIRTAVDAFTLRDANVALERLKQGQVSGSAVLVIRWPVDAEHDERRRLQGWHAT